RRTGRCAAVFTTQSFDVPGTADALDSVWELVR
ncbi:MAG: serine hydrolase, partial [Dietzia sp.]|nr:serine hydrolase [Dietzia sp.]